MTDGAPDTQEPHRLTLAEARRIAGLIVGR